MTDLEVAEILELDDEALELEFEKASIPGDLESKIKVIKAASPNPITVGSWNSCTGACCCTLNDGSNAYLPNCTDCLPGGV